MTDGSVAHGASEIRVELRACPRPHELASVELGLHAVHVWQASQDLFTAEMANLSAILSPDERHRKARFRFEKDQSQFTIARGLLRTLLGSYLGCPPNTISFSFSDKGKPSLARPAGSDIHFNVAHSGGLILLAFSRTRRIGIDVEKIRHDFAVDEIAERFFSEAERTCLRQWPATERHEAFFRCWTRKEAYIKATGDGLSLPLSQFDVSLTANDPARLLATRPIATEADHWSMHNIEVVAGYAAALVVERK